MFKAETGMKNRQSNLPSTFEQAACYQCCYYFCWSVRSLARDTVARAYSEVKHRVAVKMAMAVTPSRGYRLGARSGAARVYNNRVGFSSTLPPEWTEDRSRMSGLLHVVTKGSRRLQSQAVYLQPRRLSFGRLLIP